MRAVEIPSDLLDRMRQHAHTTYPDECCGFLVATSEAPGSERPRRIVGVEPAANEFAGERRRRFMIAPDELRAVERRLEGTGRVVAGFYHSHPDRPARPSAFDQEHAWPWYSYIVLATTASAVTSAGAFELDPTSRTFREVPLRSVPSEGPGVTERIFAVVATEGRWDASP
jgi:proteasome lid subunit RPN8/RPN11